jgi:hypothetical protein
MGEKMNGYRLLVGRRKGKKPLGRPRRKWMDNIKMYFREIELRGMDWINLPQDRNHVFIDFVMNFGGFLKMLENF